jgi:toxin ParE1/3/4
VRIEWLPEAARNLTAQLEWLAERDPWAAIDVGDAVHAAVERLAEHPSIGRPGRVPFTRELMIVGTPYIMVYRIEETVVLVLRVLHGVQRWPPA